MREDRSSAVAQEGDGGSCGGGGFKSIAKPWIFWGGVFKFFWASYRDFGRMRGRERTERSTELVLCPQLDCGGGRMEDGRLKVEERNQK